MSGGGKGGSTSTSVQVPAWLEGAAQQNLARADRVAQLGYTPYYGPDVAAFSPMQQAAMQGTNQAALAFGMPSVDAMAGMPQAQTFAGGVQGYSSAPLYQQSVEALAANDPGLYRAMGQMFIDPNTGAQPGSPFGSGAGTGSMGGKGGGSVSPAVAMAISDQFGGRNRDSGGMAVGGGSRSTTSMATLGSYMPGGVNTNNPASLGNRVAAAATSKSGKSGGSAAPTGGRAASAPPGRSDANKRR